MIPGRRVRGVRIPLLGSARATSEIGSEPTTPMSGSSRRTAALTLTAVSAMWLAIAALGREPLARLIPSLNDPFRTWPLAYATIPLVVSLASLIACVRAGRPRTADEGWNGATMVGAFVAVFATLVWAVILLARITPTS